MFWKFEFEQYDENEDDRIFGPEDKGIFDGIKNPQIRDDSSYIEYQLKRFGERISKKDWINEDNYHVLHELAELNFTELLKEVLTLGENVNVRNLGKKTPLHCAAFWGNVESAKVLLENGALIDAIDVNGTSPLHVASENGYVKMIEFLIENGADMNLPETYSGNTPIIFATKYKRTGAVELLLKLGARLDIKSKEGYSPRKMAKEVLYQRTQKLYAEYDFKNSSFLGRLFRSLINYQED